FEIGLARDRSQAAGDCPFEWLGRRVLSRRFALDVGSHGPSRSPHWRGEANLRQRHVDRTLRQFDAEAALIELRHDRPFQLVALVQEREPEGETDIVEYFGILRP